MKKKKDNSAKSPKKEKLNKLNKKGSKSVTRKTGAKTRGKNGGAREGAGRKPGVKTEATLIKEELADKIKNHGSEEVEIAVTIKGKIVRLKKPRVLIVLEKVFQEVVSHSNMSAATIYMDRVAGKAMQPVKHEGEIKTHEQGRPKSKAVTKAIEAYHEAMEEEDEEE